MSSNLNENPIDIKSLNLLCSSSQNADFFNHFSSNSEPQMASILQINQFPCGAVSPTCQNQQKPSIGSPSSMSFTRITPKSFSSVESSRVKPVFITRVSADAEDEWGTEKKGEEEGGVAVAVAEEEQAVTETEVDRLKKALVDSFYGTDRGLSATSETRAEIVELITQLEAKNPNPAPTEALTLLNGKWILAYTSFSGLYPLLSRTTLPLVKVEEISQTIDSENLTVQNSIQFSGPLATTSIQTNAKFEVRSPKRVQIKFEEGIIGTPQVTDSIVLPENVEFLGQKIDLTPIKGFVTSVQDTASSVAKTISSQPPLKIPITSSNAQSWLLTTYLDEDLRISRGDAGSVFVLIKEGSHLLTP